MHVLGCAARGICRLEIFEVDDKFVCVNPLIGLLQCVLSVAISSCFYEQMFLRRFDPHVLFDALEMKDQFLDL